MPSPLRVFDPEPSGRRQPSTTGRVDQMQDAIDLYVENLHARRHVGDYSEDALDGALRALRRFGAEFGYLAISSSRQNDITRFLGLNPQWKAASTKKRVVSTILAAFRWLKEEEFIERCPYHWPKCLKGLPDKVRRPADRSEYVTLMRFGSKPLRRALFILHRVGIRTKEMRDLVWPEVVLDDVNRGPHLRLDKHKTFKKTGKPRFVGLDAATASFLRALRYNQRCSGEQHVFLNTVGRPWGRHTFAQHLRRYAEHLGIDEGVDERVSGYSFRHKYVCDGIEGGVTTRRIADQVGHSTTAVIDKTYGSHTRERVEHLDDVATEIRMKRKRGKKPAKKTEQRGDGFHHGLEPE